MTPGSAAADRPDGASKALPPADFRSASGCAASRCQLLDRAGVRPGDVHHPLLSSGADHPLSGQFQADVARYAANARLVRNAPRCTRSMKHRRADSGCRRPPNHIPREGPEVPATSGPFLCPKDNVRIVIRSTAEIREQAFEDYLEGKTPYNDKIVERNAKPWFSDPKNREKLAGVTGIANDAPELEARRALHFRRYQRPPPPQGMSPVKSLKSIQRVHE